MYYDEYNDYTKEYRQGAYKISHTRHKIQLDKNFSLSTRRFGDNYNLYFSRKGVLSCLIEYRFDLDNKISKVTRYLYTYIKDQYITMIIGHDLITNMLTEKIEFDYNADNQIAEERITSYYHTGAILQETECNHYYKDNYHMMQHYDATEEVEHIFETWYNGETGEVELKIKKEDGSFTDWIKKTYDKSGHLVRQCHFHENGTIWCESEYFYTRNKIVQMDYGEKKEVYETLIDFDKKHNWSRKSHFKNGELNYVEEQTIEYYAPL